MYYWWPGVTSLACSNADIGVAVHGPCTPAHLASLRLATRVVGQALIIRSGSSWSLSFRIRFTTGGSQGKSASGLVRRAHRIDGLGVVEAEKHVVGEWVDGQALGLTGDGHLDVAFVGAL